MGLVRTEARGYVSAVLIVILVGITMMIWLMDGNDVQVLEDGVYRGSAEGYQSEIVVDVTVSDGGIKAIEVVDHGETQGIGDAAFDEMIPSIIEAQSLHVDIVSGATASSRGLLSAVQVALEDD